MLLDAQEKWPPYGVCTAQTSIAYLFESSVSVHCWAEGKEYYCMNGNTLALCNMTTISRCMENMHE